MVVADIEHQVTTSLVETTKINKRSSMSFIFFAEWKDNGTAKFKFQREKLFFSERCFSLPLLPTLVMSGQCPRDEWSML